MKRLAAAAVFTLVAVVPAGTAWASADGGMIVVPPTGTIDSAIDVVTDGVCEQGVTFVVAVRGKGLDPVTSGNAVGSTELRILEPSPYPGHHAVPLSRTLREYFTTNGVGSPVGDYDLVFACRNRLDMADLQTFTARISIDKSGAYQAVGAAATPLEELLAAPAGASPARSGSSPEKAAGDPSARDSDDVAETAPETATPEIPGTDRSSNPSIGAEAAPSEKAALASPDVTQASASTPLGSEDTTWRTVLIGMGILLLAGASYMGWKARTR